LPISNRGDDAIGLDREDGLDITDRSGAVEIFTTHAPEVVYHLAARTHVGDSWTSAQQVIETNVVGTLNVLDAARAAGARRVLVVRQREEYGPRRAVRRSAHRGVRTGVRSRRTAREGSARGSRTAGVRGSGLETIRVRAFNHTGPGQPPRFLVPALAHRIAMTERAGGDQIAVGNLDPVREVNDVRDIVRAYRLLVLEGTAGDVYNVCGASCLGA